MEAGALEHVLCGGGVAEGERVGPLGRRRRPAWQTERVVDGQRPWVVLTTLPGQRHQARAGPQCARDVGERGDRVGEEHDAEPADGEIERLRSEAMHLRVAALVGHVVKPLCGRELTCTLEHRPGDIDAQHVARRRGACGVARRLPGSAADVEHAITRTDAGGGAQPAERSSVYARDVVSPGFTLAIQRAAPRRTEQ